MSYQTCIEDKTRPSKFKVTQLHKLQLYKFNGWIFIVLMLCLKFYYSILTFYKAEDEVLGCYCNHRHNTSRMVLQQSQKKKKNFLKAKPKRNKSSEPQWRQMGKSTFETSGWNDQNNHAAPEGDRLWDTWTKLENGSWQPIWWQWYIIKNKTLDKKKFYYFS